MLSLYITNLNQLNWKVASQLIFFQVSIPWMYQGYKQVTLSWYICCIKTFINFIMVIWFCSSALCLNNYKSKDSNGEKLKYCFPKENSEIQWQYRIIFRTDGFHWDDGHMCCLLEYWVKKKHDMPDIPIPKDQFEKIEWLAWLIWNWFLRTDFFKIW